MAGAIPGKLTVMKVLILETESQLYLAHRGEWTYDPFVARDFSFTVHARTVAQGMQLKSFQIVFFFPEINYRIVVQDSEGEARAGRAA